MSIDSADAANASYTWHIRNSSWNSIRPGDKLCSPTFFYCSTDDKGTTSNWKLIFIPNISYAENGKRNIGLYLSHVDNGKNEINVQYKLTIRNSNYELVKSGSFCFADCFENNDNYSQWTDLTISPEDDLFIGCKFTELDMTSALVTRRNGVTMPFFTSLTKLSTDIRAIYENMMQFSDVTLHAGKEHHKAHKFILAARSPVFARMFASDMVEMKLNTVNIVDIESNVCEEMIRFIYTGEAPHLKRLANKLIAAANKVCGIEYENILHNYLLILR